VDDLQSAWVVVVLSEGRRERGRIADQQDLYRVVTLGDLSDTLDHCR
jgi:hypothetical protein